MNKDDKLKFLQNVVKECKGKPYDLKVSIISLRLNELNTNQSLYVEEYKELNGILNHMLLKEN